jgi:predicted nucleic acid-binding protein
MSAVFADTFYWIALTNLQDSEHERAKHFSRSVRPAAIVTTEYVLTEYLNYFAAWGRNFRLKAAGNVEAILASPMVILPHSQDFFAAGLELYRNRLDKGYSLTDCVSMSVMRQEGISDALTNDVHFVQEGFRALFQGKGT